MQKRGQDSQFLEHMAVLILILAMFLVIFYIVKTRVFPG